MAGILGYLSVVFLLIAVTNAQDGYIIVPGFTSQTYIGLWSEWVTITLSNPPTDPFVLTITSDTAGAADIQPTTLNFDSVKVSATFRVKPNTLDGTLINFALDSAGQSQYEVPSPIPVGGAQREVTLDVVSSTYPITVDYPSEPLKIQLQFPSASSLTFTPQITNSSISVSPATVTIPAGSIAASFSLLSTAVIQPNAAVLTWVISGDESSFYANITSLNLRVRSRSLWVQTFSKYNIPQNDSQVSYAYLRDVANSSVTLTPFSPDVVFTPSTFVFTSTNPIVPFTYKANKIEPDRVVLFTQSGDGVKDYTPAPQDQIGTAQLQITVRVPSDLVQGRKSILSIAVGQRSVNGINVKFFAANMVFNPTDVTFSGTTTSFNVEITPTIVGPDTITFLTTGADKDYYATVDPVSRSVGKGFFEGPGIWYRPTLFVGIQSPPIPLRISAPPASSITVTPIGADLTFVPASLTYTPTSSLTQYFTIIPTATSQSADSSVSDGTVDFILSGPDALSYLQIDTLSYYVSRKYIQTAWSAHLASGIYTQTFLGKQYIIMVSISHPPVTPVTVKPTSAYATFDPASFTFSASNTRVKLIMTPTTAVGTTDINYMVEGDDGGFFVGGTDSVNMTIRPLDYFQAAIVPDNRTPAQYAIQVPATDDKLTQNHVYSVTFSSSALPENSLTITPRAYHISFSPPSITITNGNISPFLKLTYTSTLKQYNVTDWAILANFTLNPLIPGTHQMWLELSGPDADFYSKPRHTFVTFNQELRTSPEIYKPSSANKFGASLVVALFVVMAVLM